RMGALTWLAAHGSGLTVMGARLSIVPLGVTAVCALVTWRTALRAGEALSGHGPDAHSIADGERDWTVPMSVLLFFSGYGVVAVVVTTLAAGPTADPSLPAVLGWALGLTMAVAAPALAIGSGRAAIWASFLPPTVRAAGAVAGSVLVALLVTSALVFVAAFAWGFGDAATMTAR